MVKTYGQLYLDARKALLGAESADTASFIARQLLCHVSGKSHQKLLEDREVYASESISHELDALLSRALKGEPLAYLLGQWEFYGLTLNVDPRVLIPRDDTCAVTDLALKAAGTIEGKLRILDLCTGSGCIGLALANRLSNSRVILGDISQDALTVARKNASDLGLSGRVTCLELDVRKKPTAFLGSFDLVVSNPPYITTEEMKQLPESVAAYEPHLALHGGDDGLSLYRSIIENYTAAIKPGGFLCLEFGLGPGDAICRLLQENGYSILERSRDYNDRERAVLAQRNRKDD